MTEDLFPLYRMIAQRARRDPHSLAKLEMKELASRLVKSRTSREEMLALADELCLIENDLSGLQTKYSSRIRDAIQKEDFVINVPFQLGHRWNDAELDGHLYILVAASKPGYSKLGATTIDVEKRLKLYMRRYGYPARCFYKCRVERVFQLERELQIRLADKLVAGNTIGDSNEWYSIEASALQRVIEEYLSALPR